jgi:hypothetical protein
LEIDQLSLGCANHILRGQSAVMKATTILKRSDLHRLVWQEPISRIAKTYGLSDVGLAKICRKHDIPCPPRGHWAKKQHGHEPSTIPLPQPENDPEIELRDPADPEIAAAADRKEAIESAAKERQSEAPIVVAETLRGAHPLIALANEQFQNARTDESGFFILEKKALDITTSKGALRRALLIIDALLKALQKSGYEIEKGPAAKIDGQTVRFCIFEAMESKQELCDDVDLDGPYSFGHSRYNQKRVPSGRLTLKISDGGAYWCQGLRYTWRDTEKHRLEEQLDRFVVGLIAFAARAKEYGEQQRRQVEQQRQAELRRQEEARALAERRKLYQAEKARVQTLLTQAENRRKSRLVRELIEAVRASHLAKGPIDPAGKIGQWIQWATQQADRLDPLCESPVSILDEDLEEKEPARPTYQHW